MSSRIAKPTVSIAPSLRPALARRSEQPKLQAVPAARSESAFVSAPNPAAARLGGESARPVALPSLALGTGDHGLHRKADAIAKALGFGKFVKSAGGDGEVWRTYQNGSVDGDVLGRIRGVWVGGQPWSKGSTFIDAAVVHAAMHHHLGPFLGSAKVDGQTVYTFMSGSVAEDPKGVVTTGKDALQFAADPIAQELGLGAYARTGGGDGEVWRNYANGTVDGDMFGNVRGVWMGGTPWARNATFVSKKVVNAVMSHGLGAFQSATQDHGVTEFTFAAGTVTQDAKGNLTVSRNPVAA